jgi:DNA polymerase
MPRTLDAEIRAQLAARLNYYRDLGIYDFYRRRTAVPEEGPAGNRKPETGNLLSETEHRPLTTDHSPDRAALLRAIREDIGDCTRCKLHRLGRKQVVFGVGNPQADIMFIGEAPGADEDQQGEPFVGRAGQLLNKMIEAMGLRRADVYIANIAKCRPPGNRAPERDECETCSPFLLRQIDVIQPKVLIALGAVAAKTLLQVNAPMSELRGQWYDFRGTPLAVTYHPAYLLRDPRQKKEAWKDLQMVMRHLGMKIPSKKTE